jgi:hypothetical protein
MFKTKRDKSVEKEPNILKGVAAFMEDSEKPKMMQHKNLPEPGHNPPVIDFTNENFNEQPLQRSNSIHETGPEHYASANDKPKMKSKSRDNSKDRSSAYELNEVENALRGLGDDPNFKSTVYDGLGRIILEFMAQIKEVSKKANIPFNKDEDEICEEYSGYLHGLNTLIEDRVENQVQSKIDKEIKKFKTDRLNRSYMNQSETIFPPKIFNEIVQTRPSDHKIQLINQSFPTRYKFDGHGRPSVVEFLRNINYAQTQCHLSKTEFLDHMLRCTTGQVYEEVAGMVDGHISLEEIYNTLLVKYDKRKKPEQAKQELDNFVVPQDATLATVQSKIMSLGQRACLLYASEARTMAYNFDCTKALIKALPKGSHNDALKLLQDLNHEYERSPTYSEYVSAISRYAPNIDYNYKEEKNKRVIRNIDKYLEKSTRNPFRKTEVSRRQASVQQIDRRSPAPEKRRYLNEISGLPSINYDYNRYSNKNRQSNNRFQQKSNRDSYNNNSYRNKHGSSNKESLGIRGKQHCSLCGSNTHSASNGCFKMRNDFGRLVFCPPSSGSCDRCEREEGKILYHPSNLCFNREKMKQFYREGKYKFPTYQERKEMAELINNSSRKSL